MSTAGATELRPKLHAKIEQLDGDELAVVERVLRQLEINRTVAELDAATDELRAKGMLERLPQIIAEVRAQRRAGA